MEGKANPPFSFTFPIANFRITLFDLWKEEGCKGSTNADDNRGRNGSRLEKGRSFPGVLNAGGGGGEFWRAKKHVCRTLANFFSYHTWPLIYVFISFFEDPFPYPISDQVYHQY